MSNIKRYNGTSWETISVFADKATADVNGNNISTTYAKKSDVYTKTESDGKYVPAKVDNITIDNKDGQFLVTCTNGTASDTVSYLSVSNSDIVLYYGSSGIVISMDRSRPQVLLNDVSYDIAITSDLPTAISASDLATILV